MSSGARLTRGAVAVAEDLASLSTRESLIFAQAVYEYGAKQAAWSAIAGILSKHPLISRPKNFFTVQSCAAIYNYLMNQASLEQTQDIENKKAHVHLKLAQRHYVVRMAELKRDIAAEEEKFRTLVQEIDDIRSGKLGHKLTTGTLNGPQAALDVPPSPKRRAGSSRRDERKSPSAVSTPIPAAETPSNVAAVEEDLNDEFMDISSPTQKASEDVAAQTAQESPTAEEKTEEISERQTRQSSRRRRSTGTSQSVATPSPSNVLEAASPVSAPPISPGLRDKPRSKSSRKPPSKGEPIAPIPEVVMEESDEEPVEEEIIEQGVKEADEEASGRLSQPVEEHMQEVSVPSHESTPAPQVRRDTKRRASDAEVFTESTRDKKKAREESEPFEDAESPATPSASTVGTTKNQKERKRFQNVIYMLHSQISQHRNGTIFHNPIKPSEAPDYHDIVKRPMDLKTIKNRVRDGIITTSSEYQRDIYLMFANSLMYNRPNSDIYSMAEEMMNDAEAHINSFRQTEGFTARTRT